MSSSIAKFYQERFGSSYALERAAYGELQQLASEVGIDYQTSYRMGKNYGRGVKNLEKSLNGKTAVFKNERRTLGDVCYPILTFHNQKEGRTVTFNGYAYLKSEYEFARSGAMPAPRPIIIQGPSNESPLSEAKERRESQLSVEDDLTLFDSLPKANPDFPYLEKNKIAAIAGHVDVRQGNDYMGDFVAFRLFDVHGKAQGLQKIYANGKKRFTTGMDKSGSFIVLGELKPGKKAYLSTGFSTSVSVYLALKGEVPVVVAFDDSNLLVVGGLLRGFYQGLKLVYVGDNDAFKPKAGNSGMRAVLKACFQFGGRYVVPEFGPDNAPMTDFNDLHVAKGLLAVASQLKKTKAIPSKGKAQSLALKMLAHGGTDYLQANLKACILKLMPHCPLKTAPSKLISNVCQHLPAGLDEKALNDAKLEISALVEKIYEQKKSEALLFKEAKAHRKTGDMLSYLEVDALDDALLKDIQSSRRGIFIIQGPTGCGKTKFMSSLIGADERAGDLPLYVTGRELLTAQAAERLQIPNYQSVVNGNGLSSLAICWNSLINPKFSSVVDNTRSLYIDEPTMTFRHGLCGTVNKANDVLDKFKDLLAQAQKMVLCDADMSDQFVDFMLDNVNNSLPVVFIRVKTKPREKTIRYTLEQSVVLDELLSVASRGERFMLMCDSREKLVEINAILSERVKGIKLLQVDSQNKDKNTQLFIKNPDVEIQKYQGLLCSPAISCGVSIEQVHFEHHFAIFGGCSIIPQDALQMLARDRTLKSALVSLNEKNRYELEDEAIYYHERRAAFLKSHQLAGISVVELSASEESFSRLHSYIKTTENKLRNDFANNFILQAQHDGYDVVVVQGQENKELTKALKEARVARSRREAVAIAGQSLPSDMEALRLEGMSFRTQAQSWQLQKYILARGLGKTELTFDDIEYGIQGGAKFVSNMVGVLSGDGVLAKKDGAQREAGIPMVQLKNHLVRKHILEIVFDKLGIDLADGLGIYTEVQAKSVIAAIREEEGLADAFNGCHLGVRLAQEIAYPVRFINDLLKCVFGLKVDVKQVQRQKVRVREYQFERSSFERLMGYARLRTQELGENVHTCPSTVLKKDPCVHSFDESGGHLPESMSANEGFMEKGVELDSSVLDDWIDVEF